MMLVPISLLASLPVAANAFSTAPPSSLVAAAGRRQPLPLPARHAALESVAEPPFEADSASGIMAELLPELSSSPAADSAASIQSRSIDKDTLINASIFLFAVGVVLERVLSVDVGITRGWSPAEIAERIPLDNWRSYTNILNMAPLQTKAVTSATVYTIGDVIAQTQEGTEFGKIDRWRVGRSLAAGFIGHGPMCHVWYHVSEDFFDNVVNLHHAWWSFMPKILVDQFVFGPIWNNSYILLLGIMQLQRPAQIWDDMKRTTVPLVISGLKLWPFVHCITYGLIPVENRLLWVDLVEIVWVTILATTASSTGKASEGGELAPAAAEGDVKGER